MDHLSKITFVASSPLLFAGDSLRLLCDPSMFARIRVRWCGHLVSFHLWLTAGSSNLARLNGNLNQFPAPVVSQQKAPTRRGLRVTKQQRLQQFRKEAAMRYFSKECCSSLMKVNLSWIFESFRAAIHIPVYSPLRFNSILGTKWAPTT